MASLPLIQRRRFRLGSHLAWMSSRRATARIPLLPSTITARASSIVAPTSATLRRRPDTIECTHSAPARVLPNPRPAIISQVRQSPPGAFCPSDTQVANIPSSRSASFFPML